MIYFLQTLLHGPENALPHPDLKLCAFMSTQCQRVTCFYAPQILLLAGYMKMTPEHAAFSSLLHLTRPLHYILR